MDKDSMFAGLYRQLEELDGSQITVGVQGELGKNFHGHTVSASEELQKIAWVHEFGMDIDVTPKMRAWLHYNGIHLKADTTKIHIPERSYIRRGQAESKPELDRLYKQLIGQLFAGEITADKILDTLGQRAMTITVSELGNGTTPVTQYTMDHRKGNPEPDPLVDTGSGIQNHITYRIEKKGGEGSDTTFSAGGSG